MAVTIHEAKTHLSRLIARVEDGEEIVIARGDKPAAKLVGLQPKRKGRGYGVLKGEAKLTPAFFEPLPDDELAAWEGA